MIQMIASTGSHILATEYIAPDGAKADMDRVLQISRAYGATRQTTIVVARSFLAPSGAASL